MARYPGLGGDKSRPIVPGPPRSGRVDLPDPLEVAAAFALAVSVDLGPATLYFAEMLGLVLVLPALLRLLGLLLSKETSGNWLLGAIVAAGVSLKTSSPIRSVGELLAAGFDAVHVSTPDPTYIDEFLMSWGEKVCAVGNFDVASMLSQGTPVQVQKRAKELVSSCKLHGQRYIFGTNDVLPGSAKLENVQAMISAVKQHGKY